MTALSKEPTSIDLELKEKYKRFCRTDEAADNLVQLIQQEVTKAKIEEHRKINAMQAKILKLDERLAELTKGGDDAIR
jgi:hypothetical protein